jgi:hypothetical protein
MSDLNSVPELAERINGEFDADAVIISILKDKQVGVGFTGVRMNKVLLALTLLSYATATEDNLVAYSGVLGDEVRDMIFNLVDKVKENQILEKLG